MPPAAPSCFQLRVPAAAASPARWGQLYGSADALAIADAFRGRHGTGLVVCRGQEECDRLTRRLRFYGSGDFRVAPFADLETLPYDAFSAHPDLVSDRLTVLHDLLRAPGGMLVVAAAATLMHRLPPVDWVAGSVFRLNVGERLDIDAFRKQLDLSGYRSVPQVTEHGEFALRGSVLDLFPMGVDAPVRLDLLDDEIDSIRYFDPDTQLSGDPLPGLHALPGREFPLDDSGRRGFRQRFRARFPGDPATMLIYREISRGNVPGGIEYFLPLFFDDTACLADYLPGETTLFLLEGADEALDTYRDDIRDRYEQLSVDPERPLLLPEEAFWPTDEVRRRLHRLARVEIHHHELLDADGAAARNLDSRTPPGMNFNPREHDPGARLSRFLEDFDGRVLFVAESAGRRELLAGLLRERGLAVPVVSGWREFLEGDAGRALTVAALDSGLLLAADKVAVIGEDQLFGERARTSARRRRADRDPNAIIRNLGDLNPGAPVVHEEYGVGRYLGLQTLEVGESLQEFLVLQYAGGDKLYVPVHSLHLISRYTGASPEHAPLHRLGTDQWAKARRKAAQRVRDVAAELLDVYARRAARRGHAFHVDEREYRRFAAEFPFDETEDQEAAIRQVLEQMGSDQPMDLVVCGDVGFGKTEVALRAAFVAVQDGSQVAVLVPTTLLAQQHYQTFVDRFADWPVRVEVLSRFRSGQAAAGVRRDLAAGKVDIVIGTHRLLSPDIRFRNLGLVIIDEEHRFGVRHKERLRSLRAEVDALTLTATPIPRTLNMALGGLRDLALITTPPAERLTIKTFVTRWSNTVIREACLREIRRGGQVYFVHNTVESIERVAAELRKLVPEAGIQVAHGQMRERELERIMLDFYHRRISILVCTTIIESGIDVPNANTIIINRADRMGLAQLHQLRGRVGRSHHRAFAYLIAPPAGAMTADAAKRLEAIESLEDLGSGFMLATHDLEIRGAGELLGDEQSGHVQEVGFSLYLEMLEQAVKALKQGTEPELDKPLHRGAEVDLGTAALIPEDYLPDVHMRLVLYKRIANAENTGALDDLQVEMIDRFGLLPTPARTLFRISELKLLAAPLGVRKINAGPAAGRIVFGEDSEVDPLALVGLVQADPATYSLSGSDTLRFRADMDDTEARIAVCRRLLKTLTPESRAA